MRISPRDLGELLDNVSVEELEDKMIQNVLNDPSLDEEIDRLGESAADFILEIKGYV